MLLRLASSSTRRAGNLFARTGVARSFADSAGIKKVLIPTSLDVTAKGMLEAEGFTVVQDTDLSLDELATAHPDTYGMIVRSEKIGGNLLPKLPNLKLVIRAGAGYNTIDTKACRRRQIDVMNTPGANANAVAEEVIAMILASLRHLIPADTSTRAGLWEKKKFMGKELAGKTVGILGLGAIGQLIVKRLKGFDCKILAHDPMMSDGKAENLGAEMVSPEILFAESDIITLHVPATPQTIGMVNDELLSSMPNGAILINCARDGVVDIDALKKHKAAKKLVYCTDVYAKDEAGEKPIAPLADIMLPHLGASTQEANRNAATRAASQMIDYTNKGVSQYIVNRSIPPGLDPMYQKLAFYVARVGQAFLGQELQTQMVDTTFHGALGKYAEFLAPQVLLGLGNNFDSTFDMADAKKYLKDRGIKFTNRDEEHAGDVGSSITIDLVKSMPGQKQQEQNYQRVTIRGTMTEHQVMISRINNYSSLYFNPIGHSIMIEYEDAPGILAATTAILARYHVNIIDIRAPQSKDKKRTLAIVMVDQPTTEKMRGEIKAALGAVRCVALDLD